MTNETLIELITEIATKNILDCLARHPEHDFYTAALSTIDDAMYISSSINYLDNINKVIGSSKYYSDDDYLYIKWSPCEWGEFEYINSNAWEPVDTLLSEMYEKTEEGNFSQFRNTVLSSMVHTTSGISKNLLAAGKQVFVFATIYDSVDAGRIVKESAILANSKDHPLLNAFLREAKDW